MAVKQAKKPKPPVAETVTATVEEFAPKDVGVCSCENQFEKFAPVLAAITIDIVTNQINIINFWREFRDKGDELRTSVLSGMFKTNSEIITVISDLFQLDEKVIGEAQRDYLGNTSEQNQRSFADGYRLVVNSMLPKEHRRSDFPFEPIMYQD